MYDPTPFSYGLIIFGLITCLPLLFAQLIMLIESKSPRAKELLIGKGEDWKDNTHFKSAYGLAITDWVVFFPIFTIGIAGICMGEIWGYLCFSIAGAIQFYINMYLWFLEKEYVFKANGPLKYYTYLWGNFMYWGVAALLYGIVRSVGIVF